jgi:ParB/RepB/Spo0J family partition protein
MAEQVRLVSPIKVKPNKENPRLIFRESEIRELEQSISKQGILVPLTVYAERGGFRILDGERRWRCASRLKLTGVPVIVQPKPAPLENLMMMFAIHHTRKDWDPLPTAYSLQKLSFAFEKKRDSPPSESELAQLASMTRGEVRRLRALLALPKVEQKELMRELDKPREQRTLTADQVLEATKAAAQLHKRNILNKRDANQLRRAVVQKFRRKLIKNTVDPRKLARLARAVERDEVSMAVARRVTRNLINKPDYSIDDAFSDSVEQHDYLHSTTQIAVRLVTRLQEQSEREYEVSDELAKELKQLATWIKRILGN